MYAQCPLLLRHKKLQACLDTLRPLINNIKSFENLWYASRLSLLTRPSLSSLRTLAHATTWVVLLIPMTHEVCEALGGLYQTMS